MFKLLESKNDYNVKVKIASLSPNDQYQKKCNDLGAEFICLSGNHIAEKYKSLIDQSKNALALVWNGAPVHLDYVSKRSDNVVWWTHRFHPNFERVKLRISADSSDLTATFNRFGKQWHLFDAPFEIKNLNVVTHWETRKCNFGTFCRDELINNKEHWENVKEILLNCDQLNYHYACRQEIHPEWCKKFDIDLQRVRFRGWLPEPENSIVEMAFLLDGPILGHGLMGMEALAAGIPIINPGNAPGFYNNFLELTHFTSIEKKVLEKVRGTIFQNPAEVHSVSNRLMDYEINYEVGIVMRENFIKYNSGKGTFREFCDKIRRK